MAALLLGEFVDTKSIYKSFQDFVQNNVLGIAAGIVVGISSYHFIRSATQDVFLPLVNVVLFGGLRFIHPKSANKLNHMFFRSSIVQFQWVHFLSEFMTWFVMLMATYAVMRAFLGRVAGRRTITNNKGDPDGTSLTPYDGQTA